MYVADVNFATEAVSLSADDGTVINRVLQPGDKWVTALRPTRIQVWTVSQATEPQTITALVEIRPSRCPYGIPATRVRFGTSYFNSR